MRAGQRIRLRGQGGKAERGGPAGDLFLVIALRAEPNFQLEGNDVHTILPVSPWIAALGGEALLKTLNGTVHVKVPAGSSSGRKIRLRGKGYPAGETEVGDLYAEVRVMVPKTLSDKERELFESLAEASKFAPDRDAKD